VTASSTTCSGGSTASGQNNPATGFAIANTKATISLSDVTVTNHTGTTTNSYGTLPTAAALNPGTWGTSGADGGNVTFTTKGVTLVGDVIVDDISTAALVLNKDSSGTASSLTGAINAADTGKKGNLTLDSTSKWVVTGTSYLTSLTDADTTYSNISVYMLEVDEDSRLGREMLAGGARYYAELVPADDGIAQMYTRAIERLALAGLEQYEISKRARPPAARSTTDPR